MNPEDVLRDLDDMTERSIRRVVALAYQAITIASPTDTGWFRGRWIVSPTRAVVRDDTRPRPRARAQREATVSFANGKLSAMVAERTYRLEQGPVYISNGTSYGSFLNAGSSSQAPARFVERAVASAIRLAG